MSAECCTVIYFDTQIISEDLLYNILVPRYGVLHDILGIHPMVA